MARFLAFPDVPPLCGLSPANLRAVIDRFGPGPTDPARRLIADETDDVLASGRGRVALLELFTVRQLVLAAELARVGLSWDAALLRALVFVGIGGAQGESRIEADGSITTPGYRDPGALFADGRTALLLTARGAQVVNFAPGARVDPVVIGGLGDAPGESFTVVMIDTLWARIDRVFAERGIG